MCLISDQLKLCSCKSSVDKRKHYWVLYRFAGDKEMSILGEPMLPAFIDPAKDSFNRALLLQLLNEGNAFDEPLYPVDNDRLQLTFTIAGEGFVHYGFAYDKNVWVPLDFDYFEWVSTHDEMQTGKVKNPFQRS